MADVDEIERCRKRNKVLKEKSSKYQEETNHIITDLRNQLQEAKKSEGISSSYSQEENSRF